MFVIVFVFLSLLQDHEKLRGKCKSLQEERREQSKFIRVTSLPISLLSVSLLFLLQAPRSKRLKFRTTSTSP